MQTENPKLSSAQQLLEQARELIHQGQPMLILAGRAYNLSEWLTTKCYAQKYNLESTMVITTWLARGIIPAESVIRIEELNGLTLIQDRIYQK